MEADRNGETYRQKTREDGDCPPPIPPRPSFTFAASRDSLARRGSATAQQVHTETVLNATIPSPDVQTDEPMSGGIATQDGGDSRKPPMPLPRYKSKKSADQSSVVETEVTVCCDNVLTPESVTDEVFLADTRLADDKCKDDQTQYSVSESVSSEIVSAEVHEYHESEEQSLPRTGCTEEQVTVNSSSDGSSVPDQVTGMSDVTLPCQLLTDGRAETISTVVVVPDGSDSGLPNDSEINDTSVHHVRTEATEVSEVTANIEQPSKDSLQVHSQTSPKPRAPVVSFSELDDFGLDPDLFRSDSLESDVPFSEQMARFTRSASPMYERVLDEDETGLCYASCLPNYIINNSLGRPRKDWGFAGGGHEKDMFDRR